MSANEIYEFGPFRLDPAERLLLREGRPVPLAPKAFDTLVVLLENSGHLVKKDDLMKRVWPDAFVEEVNLAQNVSAIRRILETKNGGGPYIETVTKGGYRFTTVVRRVSAEPPATTPVVEPASAVRASPSRKNQRSALVLLLAGLAITLLGLNFPGLRDRILTMNSSPRIESLAVLPLENLSHDTEQEYFADGMTDELITDLAKIHSLRVISRN